MKNVLDQHVGLFTHWLEITLGIGSVWKRVVSFWPISQCFGGVYHLRIRDCSALLASVYLGEFAGTFQK